MGESQTTDPGGRVAYAVLAAVVVLVLVLTVVSARSGRPARSCCAPADPSQDLRMRDAFGEEPAPRPQISVIGADLGRRPTARG